MAQLSNLDISELDFDEIKQNLKNFLQQQDTFTDYDFEGSGLSTLLDILAYNTHYNAYIGNMLLNEMFLDSAVKRSSAISIAKQLGFTPSSVRSARANVNVRVNNPPGSPDTLTIPARTSFSTSLENNTFAFTNLESATIIPNAGDYILNGLELVEGTNRLLSFVSSNPGPDEKFEIPDIDIDTSTIKVTVQGSQTNTTSLVYAQTTDISNVDPSSRIFFLEMTPSERYQIFFGDGIVGNKLIAGNLVNVEFLKSSGTAANSSNNAAVSFTTSTIGGTSNVVVTTASNPTTGKDADSITDIKFKAPRVNSARNRAVTANDFKSIIEANFTEAESVIVYGGEDNIPPKFGKVIISLKPFDGFTISQTTKDRIATNILRNKKVMAVEPEFIDPEFFFVNLVVNITYNDRVTSKTTNEIQTIVTNTIDGYFDSDLRRFDKDFVKAKLIKNILESDTSIVSAILLVKIQTRTTLDLNQINTFSGDESFQFGNRIEPGSIESSRFFENVQNVSTLVNITDVPNSSPPDRDGTGTLVVRNAINNIILNTNTGNVNYLTGEIVIDNFTPTALPNNILDFRITAAVQEVGQNIQANRNQILLRDKTIINAAAGRDAGLTVNVTPITED